jgi:hypothetical protein
MARHAFSLRHHAAGPGGSSVNQQRLKLDCLGIIAFGAPQKQQALGCATTHFADGQPHGCQGWPDARRHWRIIKA